MRLRENGLAYQTRLPVGEPENIRIIGVKVTARTEAYDKVEQKFQIAHNSFEKKFKASS